MTRMRMGLLGLLLTLALAVAACSGGGGKPGGVASLGDGKATSTTSAVQQGVPPSPQELAPLRAFAVCMRAHGIDMSDPQPNGNMTTGAATRDQEQNAPAFKAAEVACRDKLPAEQRQPRK